MVVCTHLTAYESKRVNREYEMASLDKTIKEMVVNNLDSLSQTHSGEVKNIFLLGDLNLHYPGENTILENHDFQDLWLERYSHSDGYTWDTQQNTMTGWMYPFDNRRMRLDRICLKNSTDFDLIEIKVVAKKKLDRIILNSSDHFGLLATFKRSKTGFKGGKMNKYKEEFAQIPPDVHGFRKMELIVTYRTIAALVIASAIVFFSWKIIDKIFN